MKEIEAAYIARKRSQGVEVPKYLKITEIDMSRDTFKKVLMLPKVITENQINEFITNGQLHN
jgi:predicted outer membrane protein